MIKYHITINGTQKVVSPLVFWGACLSLGTMITLGMAKVSWLMPILWILSVFKLSFDDGDEFVLIKNNEIRSAITIVGAALGIGLFIFY